MNYQIIISINTLFIFKENNLETKGKIAIIIFFYNKVLYNNYWTNLS